MISPREFRVWRMICDGAKMTAIASEIGIALDTARSDRRKLKLKLGLKMGNRGEASTVELVRRASDCGMI